MSDIRTLQCRECGKEYAPGAIYACEMCFGPLEVVYDYAVIGERVSHESIQRGAQSLWRYASLLPVDEIPVANLGTGFTPLIKAERLGAEIGLPNLYVKDDTRNPTGSFKDRVVAVAMAKAHDLKFSTIACASTGNLAHSVAAHAAKAGVASFVFVPETIEEAKITATAVYGGVVVTVAGNYDKVNRLCAEVAGTFPWAFVNVNLRPYYAEGSKTLAFETAEQLGWRVPDHCVVPCASGSLLTKIHKGFEELHKVWLLSDKPETRISGAQAEGCAPIANAFHEDAEWVTPVKPDTIAKSLAIGDPADGVYAIDVVKKTGGSFGIVSDAEVVEAMQLLARTEGIFAETAGGVTIATVCQLAAKGVIRPDEKVVAYVTGHGLKTMDALHKGVKTMETTPSLSDFQHVLLESGYDASRDAGGPGPVLPFATFESRFSEG